MGSSLNKCVCFGSWCFEVINQTLTEDVPVWVARRLIASDNPTRRSFSCRRACLLSSRWVRIYAYNTLPEGIGVSDWPWRRRSQMTFMSMPQGPGKNDEASGSSVLNKLYLLLVGGRKSLLCEGPPRGTLNGVPIDESC